MKSSQPTETTSSPSVQNAVLNGLNGLGSSGMSPSFSSTAERDIGHNPLRGLARSRWADEEPEPASTSATTLSPLAPAYAPNAGQGQGGPATAATGHQMSGQEREASGKAAKHEEVRKRQFAGKKYGGPGPSRRGGLVPSTSPAPAVASSSASLPMSSSPAAKRAARAGEPLEYGAGPIEGRFGPKRVAFDGEEDDDGAGPAGGKGHKKQRGNDHDDLDGDETPRAGSPAPKPIETETHASPAGLVKLVIKGGLKVRGDNNLVCIYRTPDETNRVLMAAGARVAGIEGGQSSQNNADGMLREIRMNLDASIDVRGSGNYIGHPKAILAVAKILDFSEQQPEGETESAAAVEAEDQQQDSGDEDAVEGAKHGKNDEGDDETLVRAEEAESHEG